MLRGWWLRAASAVDQVPCSVFGGRWYPMIDVNDMFLMYMPKRDGSAPSLNKHVFI